jgi:hypothetical protein
VVPCSAPPPLLLLVVQQENLAIYSSSSSSCHGELLLKAPHTRGIREPASTAALTGVADGGDEALASGISEEVKAAPRTSFKLVVVQRCWSPWLEFVEYMVVRGGGYDMGSNAGRDAATTALLLRNNSLVAESSLLCGGSSPTPRRLPYSAGSSPTPQRLPYTTSSSFAPLRVSCSTTAPHLPHNISPYLLAPSLPCAGSQARWARRHGPNVGDNHEDPLNNQGKPA